jgi:hypothetical protein
VPRKPPAHKPPAKKPDAQDLREHAERWLERLLRLGESAAGTRMK